jgi:integrase
MGRSIEKLSDTTCRNAKATGKRYTVVDGGGLYLLVAADATKSTGRYWRYNYRFGGRQKTMALGTYPDVSLAKAREKHQEARRLLADGVDPMAERRADNLAKKASAETTFEGVAREWFAREKKRWVDSHADRILRRLERDIFPWIGRRPVAEITTPEILALLKRIQSRGAIETAHRAKWECAQVFKFAIESGRAGRDPTESFSAGALEAPVTRSHAAITDPAKVGQLLRMIDAYKGGPVVRAALRLAPLVFLRPGELRKAEWSEFDLDAAIWEIPGERMKRPKAEKQIAGGHLVPLSRQAVAVLLELHPLTGHGRFVFPSPRTGERPMSDGGVLAALRSLGYSGDVMSGHGFRATARTLSVERLKVPPEIVEMQLAHAVKDPNGRAYNRVQWLDERTSMMQRWADYLDRLRIGGTVAAINQAA